MAKNKTTKFVFPDQPPKYKVGDFVEYFFHSGFGITGQVIEDRGPIGASGVHLYAIRPVSELAGTDPVYASEDDLRPAAPIATK